MDSADQPLGEVDEFWDTSRDEACIPFPSSAGGYVCVPKNYAYVDGNQHLAADCSDADQRAYAICPPEVPRVGIRTGARSCEVPGMYVVEAAYEIGASLGVDYYFENEYVECEARTMFEYYSAYETGDPLLGELPVLELVIDE